MLFNYGDFESEFKVIGKNGEPLFKFTSRTTKSAQKAARFLDKKLTTCHSFSSFEIITAGDKFARRRIKLLTDILDNGVDPREVGAIVVSLTNIR